MGASSSPRYLSERNRNISTVVQWLLQLKCALFGEWIHLWINLVSYCLVKKNNRLNWKKGKKNMRLHYIKSVAWIEESRSHKCLPRSQLRNQNHVFLAKSDVSLKEHMMQLQHTLYPAPNSLPCCFQLVKNIAAHIFIWLVKYFKFISCPY